MNLKRLIVDGQIIEVNKSKYNYIIENREMLDNKVLELVSSFSPLYISEIEVIMRHIKNGITQIILQHTRIPKDIAEQIEIYVTDNRLFIDYSNDLKDMLDLEFKGRE